MAMLTVSSQLNIEDFVGQRHFWHKGSLLWNLVQSDRFKNLLFWGPPGSGKTSLARMIATTSKRHFVELSSATSGIADIKGAIRASEEEVAMGRQAHILFLDEIHRLSKSQQDVLLPFLERDVIRFISATTENPGFAVNKAILSRCSVFGFRQLQTSDLEDLITKSLDRKGKSLPPHLVQALANAADGDGRIALNLLNSALDGLPPEALTPDTEVKAFLARLPEIHMKHDAKGDSHYDLLSALIKSLRAGKVQAALYYLARLIAGGEPPGIIARRMLILASEDIGNANPMALVLAQATFAAVESLGYPEARITLSQCCVYLANSPKSNRSYVAINNAISFAEKTGSLPIPLYLTNAHHAFDKSVGRGTSYIYPHDHPEALPGQSYFPDGLNPPDFYEPIDSGAELKLHQTQKFPGKPI